MLMFEQELHFYDEIEALEKAGFTDEQIEAIWDLVSHVVIAVMQEGEE